MTESQSTGSQRVPSSLLSLYQFQNWTFIKNYSVCHCHRKGRYKERRRKEPKANIKASHKQGIMKERSSPFFFPSAWLVLPINKVHVNKFNSDKFNHPRTTLIKSLTRVIWKSWGREIKHSWHRGCHALTLPGPLPLHQHFQYKITPSHCTPTWLVLLPSQYPSPTLCLFIHNVSLSPWVYAWEGFRVFQYDHVQELQSPGEICATGIVGKKLLRYRLTHVTKAK